jgi:hypothetical protein
VSGAGQKRCPDAVLEELRQLHRNLAAGEPVIVVNSDLGVLLAELDRRATTTDPPGNEPTPHPETTHA